MPFSKSFWAVMDVMSSSSQATSAWGVVEGAEDDGTLAETAKGRFTGDEGMGQNASVVQE